jgi:hypothetical protein
MVTLSIECDGDFSSVKRKEERKNYWKSFNGIKKEEKKTFSQQNIMFSQFETPTPSQNIDYAFSQIIVLQIGREITEREQSC